MTEDKFVGTAEAAKYLGLKIDTIYALTHYKKLRYYKPNGKKIYFRLSDLDEYLQQNLVSSIRDIDAEAGTRVVTRRGK